MSVFGVCTDLGKWITVTLGERMREESEKVEETD